MAKEKFVRRPDYVSGELTEDEKRKLAEHMQMWIKRIMRTEPADRVELTQAIADLYAVAGKKRPPIVIVPSPLVAQISAGFAAGIWYLRKNGEDAIEDATRAATEAATRAATRAATEAATEAVTWAATRAATVAATEAATASATVAATWAATEAATAAATASATWAATRAATEAATRTATEAATASATVDATEAVTWAATVDATRAATAAATRTATEAATASATVDATEAVTWAATVAATRAATVAATRTATEAATITNNWAYYLASAIAPKQSKFLLSCAREAFRFASGGAYYAQYDSWLTAMRDVLGLRLPCHEKYDAWERAAIHGTWRFVHEEFCIVSDFPTRIMVDEQNRPHCDDGPSHQWADGWAIYHVHGVRVPGWIIEQPALITAEKVKAEANAEVRRVMIERYPGGEAQYIQDSGMKPVAHDEVFGTLYVEHYESGRPIAKIRVTNRSPEPDGTFKHYWLDVNPAHYNGDAGRVPQAAVASTWRVSPTSKELVYKDYRDYRPIIET